MAVPDVLSGNGKNSSDTAVPSKDALPSRSEFIEGLHPAAMEQVVEVADLPDFLQMAKRGSPELTLGAEEVTAEIAVPEGQLTLADRQLLVEQALLMLEMTYVHLHLKEAMYGIDPLQKLRLLQHRLAQMTPETMPPEIQFHNEMTEIFCQLRDLHTNYLLPAPFNRTTAVLPFLVEEYFEDDQPRYMVSKVFSGFETETFKPGVEVLYWNGVPIRRAIEVNAEKQAGSNQAAKFAQGLGSLTIRPLIRSLPPDEEWVVVGYRTESGELLEHRQGWLVYSAQVGASGVDPDEKTARSTALAYDIQTDRINETKKLLYAPKAVAAAQQIEKAEARMASSEHGVDTTMPTVFRAYPVDTPHGTFGYIRIFTFNVNDDEAFVQEFIRLVEGLPQNGLIVDVRSNGGGLIYASERLLQVLTAVTIEPERVQFINTPMTLELCDRHSPSPYFGDLDLSQWRASVRLAVQTGATYSNGFPITPPEWCNNIGQRYYGPVVLITDAQCYSATDIFAAGFQDHRIGQVLGMQENTGAGGANVWTHSLLHFMLDGPQSRWKTLPNEAGMRVAIRRTLRAGEQSGTPLEDLGVVPDELHRMTKADLLYGNVDLINHAARILAVMPPRTFEASLGDRSGLYWPVKVKTQHLNRLDFLLDDRPVKTVDVPLSLGTRTVRVRMPAGGAQVLEVRGYSWAVLVAKRKFIVG